MVLLYLSLTSVLNGFDYPRPIIGQFNSRKCFDTNIRGVLVRPMPSLLLQIDCCIVHDYLKEMNYTVRNK